jgi:hypothetical protein
LPDLSESIYVPKPKGNADATDASLEEARVRYAYAERLYAEGNYL